jgi:hypothetical protein
MTMRDFSCFRDAAVATISPSASGDHLDRSLQAATACVYRAALSSSEELLVTVTWTRCMVYGADPATAGSTGLSVAVEDLAPPPSPASAQKQQQQVLQKRRGIRSFVTEGGKAVAIHWDTSDARYPSPSSPEPCAGYYLAVVAEGEPALLLGTGAAHLSRRFATAALTKGRAVLISRREQLRAPPASAPSPTSAVVAHSTRCRFRDGGAEHEVTVCCRGDRRATSTDEGEVAVCVDGRKLVEARRVGWNFRGNRTAVLADGAIVEVMWDVHDWWFPSATGTGAHGAAQFMVKARGGGGLGVWMDEEMASKGHPPAGFFLHMQCYRR